MSLRLRLIILPMLVVVSGLILLAFLELGAARERVRLETDGGMEVGRAIIDNALQRVRQEPLRPDALAALDRDLPPVRHVRIAVGPVGMAPPSPAADGHDTPQWFLELVQPMNTEAVERYRVAHGDETLGQIVMVANPDAEIWEIWNDWRDQALVLVVLSLVLVVTVMAVVTVALRPLRTLGDGLDRLGQGDFNVELSPIQDVELRRLGQRFNSLVSSLRRVTEDNRLLIGRLMSLQEAERKEVAHELHDEFGPSLFGIRAELSSISNLARQTPPRTEEIERRVRQIGGLVEQIQKINSRLLERLRPLVLDEMGLAPALKRLVADWALRYPEITWKTRLTQIDHIDEPVALSLYRAVQECLTNVVRHAEASVVEVTLSRSGGVLKVGVRDDGKGIESDSRFGFGLLGMAERARALGGRLDVTAPVRGGTLIEIIQPLEEMAA